MTFADSFSNCSSPLPLLPAVSPNRAVGIDSLLQALGAAGADHSAAAQQLRAEIERLEQQEAELLDYGEQDEEEEDDMVRGLQLPLRQWRIQGGSLGSAEPPFLSFCAHALPTSCARTIAAENVLDSGTPLSKS